MPHQLWKDGDQNIPVQLLDQAEGGQVALSMCKVCGQAEVELEDFCPGPRQAAATPPAPASDALLSEHLLIEAGRAAEGAFDRAKGGMLVTEMYKQVGEAAINAAAPALLARVRAAESELGKVQHYVFSLLNDLLNHPELPASIQNALWQQRAKLTMEGSQPNA